MIPYFLALLSAVCFGISNSYWVHASKNIKLEKLVIFRGIYGILILLFISIFLSNQIKGLSIAQDPLLSARETLEIIVICLLCSMGLIFYLRSLQYQGVSLTIPLTSINIFNILTSVIVLGEVFHAKYYISFPIALAGILFANEYRFKNKSSYWNKGASFSILAAFFWGITYPYFKIISPKLGALKLAIILESCVTFAALIWAFSSQRKLSLKHILRHKPKKEYFILAILLVGGTVFFNLAIQHLPIFQLTIISYIQLIIPIFIAANFYKEKTSLHQKIGIFLIICSIVISSL